MEGNCLKPESAAHEREGKQVGQRAQLSTKETMLRLPKKVLKRDRKKGKERVAEDGKEKYLTRGKRKKVPKRPQLAAYP